ncbi:MAG: hydroxymethylbilane synthase [Verrucomicrobia bacterium]|nr:hydroxymethylbilane synthase [Verrucomicrobiota bacterium]
MLRLATRGSPLALAQAEAVWAQCRAAFPAWHFEIKIVKTTGDKLQKASMAQAGTALPKGLFTKELEVALLDGTADLAVHSLKDLPTDLPPGLTLAAVGQRADARDVVIYRGPTAATPAKRGFPPHLDLTRLPHGATLATSSTRRREQLLALRPDFQIVEIRGNVGTRLQKLAERPEWDATLLAAAGIARLGFRVAADGLLVGPQPNSAPPGLLVVPLDPAVMLPCVGQAAVGIEIRLGDSRTATLCAALNHPPTMHCVTAERAFLRAMGGGCQSPVAAYAEFVEGSLRVRAVSFRDGPGRRAELTGTPEEASALGERLAAQLRPAG